MFDESISEYEQEEAEYASYLAQMEGEYVENGQRHRQDDGAAGVATSAAETLEKEVFER